ncbi:class I adenylate-forming enzyme family protein [Loktanella sp. Alg231-35]|uniref:class I adenylate-forming enzyme family protein n=1 Tax=Loktanella sp. Alg231-35 TaxID=1922220 RepID=UPI000D558DF3|nr:AMP-binding protein [Loktanella sp. Alg231-35]
MNLGYLVARSARYWRDRIALKDENGVKTYSELDERSNRLANLLSAKGLTKGDRVAVLAWNRNELVEVQVALLKGGFTRVPINARLSASEVTHICKDSGVKILLADAAHGTAANQASAEDPNLEILIFGSDDSETSYETALAAASDTPVCVDVALSDVAVHHYTSGSSGVLKAAMQTVGNRHALMRKMAFRSRLSPDQHEIFLHVGPITHASGMSILALLSMGHSNILLSRFDVDSYLTAVETEKATQTYLVPTMINRIVSTDTRHDYDLSSLRMVRYGAAPISPTRLKEAIDFFGPILNQGYGGGETCSSVTMLTEADHKRAVGDKPELLSSCGRPMFDTIVRIVDDNGVETPIGERGELVISGPDVMAGYWNAPDLTAEAIKDSVYHTGDIAYADDEGYIFIVDRKKDMIVSGGFNVYPNEVEHALYEHPGVFEACVVGAPDPDMGEMVAAVVVRRPGASVTEEELANHCATVLGKFKKPGIVSFVDELPKNDAGKVLRRVLRDGYWKEADRKV